MLITSSSLVRSCTQRFSANCFLSASAKQHIRCGDLSTAKLTKRVVDAAESRPSDYFIWDEELLGFVPAAVALFVTGRVSEHENFFMRGARRLYAPLL